jgi:LytS/YehU family sensor histidine kinase
VISSLILIFFLFFIEGYTVHYFFDSNPLEKEFGEMMRRFNEEHNLAEPPFRQFHIYNFVFTSILISGFALGLRVFERFKQQEKRQEELVKINLKTELAFLKNQISPHFFFNTLNNIYSLIEINTKHAQDAVIRLSKLMRYLLYESDHIRVNLLDELEFMKNYIELMSLRLSDKVKLEILFPQLKNSYQIPPLLFIPFLENAFKHGVSYKHESYIKISLDILDDMLQFECSNSIINGEEDEKLFSGIGLDNVKKRLELLYPNNYELDMNRSDKVFTVILKIKSLD